MSQAAEPPNTETAQNGRVERPFTIPAAFMPMDAIRAFKEKQRAQLEASKAAAEQKAAEQQPEKPPEPAPVEQPKPAEAPSQTPVAPADPTADAAATPNAPEILPPKQEEKTPPEPEAAPILPQPPKPEEPATPAQAPARAESFDYGFDLDEVVPPNPNDLKTTAANQNSPVLEALEAAAEADKPKPAQSVDHKATDEINSGQKDNHDQSADKPLQPSMKESAPAQSHIIIEPAAAPDKGTTTNNQNGVGFSFSPDAKEKVVQAPEDHVAPPPNATKVNQPDDDEFYGGNEALNNQIPRKKAEVGKDIADDSFNKTGADDQKGNPDKAVGFDDESLNVTHPANQSLSGAPIKKLNASAGTPDQSIIKHQKSATDLDDEYSGFGLGGNKDKTPDVGVDDYQDEDAFPEPPRKPSKVKKPIKKKPSAIREDPPPRADDDFSDNDSLDNQLTNMLQQDIISRPTLTRQKTEEVFSDNEEEQGISALVEESRFKQTNRYDPAYSPILPEDEISRFDRSRVAYGGKPSTSQLSDSRTLAHPLNPTPSRHRPTNPLLATGSTLEPIVAGCLGRDSHKAFLVDAGGRVFEVPVASLGAVRSYSSFLVCSPPVKDDRAVDVTEAFGFLVVCTEKSIFAYDLRDWNLTFRYDFRVTVDVAGFEGYKMIGARLWAGIFKNKGPIVIWWAQKSHIILLAPPSLEVRSQWQILGTDFIKVRGKVKPGITRSSRCFLDLSLEKGLLVVAYCDDQQHIFLKNIDISLKALQQIQQNLQPYARSTIEMQGSAGFNGQFQSRQLTANRQSRVSEENQFAKLTSSVSANTIASSNQSSDTVHLLSLSPGQSAAIHGLVLTPEGFALLSKYPKLVSFDLYTLKAQGASFYNQATLSSMRQNKEFLNEHMKRQPNKAVSGNRVFYLDHRPIQRTAYAYSQHRGTTDTYMLAQQNHTAHEDEHDIPSRLILSDNSIPVGVRSPAPGQVYIVSGPFFIKAELSNKKSGFTKVVERPEGYSQGEKPGYFLATLADQVLYADSQGGVSFARL